MINFFGIVKINGLTETFIGKYNLRKQNNGTNKKTYKSSTQSSVYIKLIRIQCTLECDSSKYRSKSIMKYYYLIEVIYARTFINTVLKNRWLLQTIDIYVFEIYNINIVLVSDIAGFNFDSHFFRNIFLIFLFSVR